MKAQRDGNYRETQDINSKIFLAGCPRHQHTRQERAQAHHCLVDHYIASVTNSRPVFQRFYGRQYSFHLDVSAFNSFVFGVAELHGNAGACVAEIITIADRFGCIACPLQVA
jgi:hypothetical protein